MKFQCRIEFSIVSLAGAPRLEAELVSLYFTKLVMFLVLCHWKLVLWKKRKQQSSLFLFVMQPQCLSLLFIPEGRLSNNVLYYIFFFFSPWLIPKQKVVKQEIIQARLLPVAFSGFVIKYINFRWMKHINPILFSTWFCRELTPFEYGFPLSSELYWIG